LIVRRNVRAMVVVSGDTISEEDVRKVERVAQSITQQSRTEIELAHRRLFFFNWMMASKLPAQSGAAQKIWNAYGN